MTDLEQKAVEQRTKIQAARMALQDIVNGSEGPVIESHDMQLRSIINELRTHENSLSALFSVRKVRSDKAAAV